jgi:HD-like signal output (HDOD) protein
LNTTINNIEVDNVRKQKTIRTLSSVYNLPTVPVIVFEVTKIIDDPRSSAGQLGKVISKDQGLVTKVLSVANSPLYGIPRRVSTIDFAIVILGFNHIKNIVIALSMMDAFKNFGGSKFDQTAYWNHSLVTATAAKRVADDLGFSFSGEAFTAGLLHDLGIPVIYKYFNKEYNEILTLVKNEGRSFIEAELIVLGNTHGEIGKILVDRWNLPIALSEVVTNHHTPSLANNDKELVAIVHLADYMTQKLGVGSFKWDENYAIDHSIIKTLNLGSEEYVENFIDSYKDLFETQLESIKF